MSEEFLKYYNRELVYLRHKGHEFGEQYPKIAARLRLSEEVVEDPHVSRLLEGCAFLTARIRQSLDNAFPQLTEALIGQLFPDFHAPIPSMSVIKVNGSSSATSTVTVPAGERVTITAPVLKSAISSPAMTLRFYRLMWRRPSWKMPLLAGQMPVLKPMQSQC
ncbi:type VI secretion system baseplate subunit TssF [Vibrio navarrensis]|uniref:type VI secretion system baseplate subunit TssF n=1 Tax=Vibrio navarrensis TaxID=29495 RepID=UPI00338E98FE